ncbi:TIGR03757 family integrating conjugative element protein [Pseudomonas fluorescens]|uniref:TIGR03757 family integrating conjugative element protein n=1 Tax=Pseudomonas fluorescens TaxID=294 RepID=UPI00031AAE9F|nr:TIGR03757 family integrating conjugative element protein [Pseudomonas fluorescens]
MLIQLPTVAALASVLYIIVLFSPAAAADVLVITDTLHPVQSPAGTRVIQLDQPARIEAELTQNLPAAPDAAVALLQQRLRDGGSALQQRIGQAYQGITDAWGLGVAKIPAIVVDRRYVVYGESDVARAVARIDAYRSTRP